MFIQKAPATIHPSLRVKPDTEIAIDLKACRFSPRYLIARTGQTVKVSYSDPIPHYFHIHPIRNVESGRAISPPPSVELMKFPLSEKLPMSVRCDIHRWMSSYWLILNHPYAAVTDVEGKFTISNLPAGEHEFIVWQERSGYVIPKPYKVLIESKKIVDQGVVKVPLSKFKL